MPTGIGCSKGRVWSLLSLIYVPGSFHRPPRGYTAQHALRAEVFIYVGPMNALSVTDDLEVRPLLWCGLRQTPGPDQRNADRSAIHQIKVNEIVRHDDCLNPWYSRHGLHVQVPHVQRILLDERPARLDFVAHEDGEDGVRVDVVLDLHAEEPALGGVHGGLPELGRVHLAETLVALDRKALLGAVVKGAERLLERRVRRQVLALEQREAPGRDGFEAELVVRHRPVLGAGDQVPVDPHLAVDAVALREETDVERAVLRVLAHGHVVKTGRLDDVRDLLDLDRVLKRGLVLDAVDQGDLEGVRRVA